MRKLCLMLSAIFCLLVNSMAQDRTITGRVTDEKGKPIPNVSVLVRGTTIGTSTSDDGNFSISVPANSKLLEISSLGFESRQISVGTQTSVTVVLASTGTRDLNEVVITGINRVKKSEFTGATTKIDEKQLRNQPVGSFDQILQGRVPGLISLTSSGAPGTASTIIIRGQGSIEGGSTPLYILDGIPVEAGVFQGLNPNDFASVDILRDAASTALYGSRGSAGVIVITTKRGIAGKPKLSYSVQMGVKERPEFAFRPMNTTELLRAQYEYGKIVGGSANANQNIPGWYYSHDNPRYTSLPTDQQAAADFSYDSLSKINTNWSDQIFRRGNFSNHQISLSGGTGKTRFYSSLDLYNEDGITLRTDMNRVTLRNNIDFSDDRFNFGVSMNLGYSKRNFQQSTVGNSLGNPFLTSAVTAPYAKVTNDDGSYATGLASTNSAANQLDATKYDRNYEDQFKGTLGITTGYKITNTLTASVTTGIDFRETQNTNYGSKLAFNRISSSSITGQAGFQIEGLDRFITANVRPSLTFKNLFHEKHEVEATVLGEYVKEIDKFFSFTGFGTDPKRPNSLNAITQGDNVNQLYSSVGGGKSQNVLLSGLITARYTYNEKYTFSASYRKDGSSKLPEQTRWQGFYTVGAIWNASKENFIKNISAINTLRLKLSYGGSGNANNFPGGDYPYQVTYDQGSYSGLNSIVATYPGNNNLKWETTYVTNLGVDFELLKRRLYGDVNLYNKITKDLFIAKKLSAVAGFGTGFTQNINGGKLGNKGIEVTINGEIIRNSHFVWTVFGNFGYNKNRVLSLAGEPAYEAGTELINEGYALGTHYEVKWAGVDAATGQPLYYDKNGNVVNVRSDDDRVQTFGTWEAPWKGGFGSSVQFKGFDLSVLFSWERGATKVDNMEYFVENPVGFLSNGYNQSSDLHFWQKPGDIVSTPSPLYGTSFSSKLIHDASFLRLRDLTLSYTVPKTMLEHTKFLSNVRFFMQGSNLFLWTKWRGRDPEAGATNINLSEFPNPRTITGGLDITF